MAKKDLVIVESPTKARTISRYLGKKYEVKASKGHIKDLPKTKLGVEIDNGFKPDYIIIPEKREVVEQLKEAASKAEKIFLAADPDREGEAICWHLKEELEPVNPRIKRVTFHEITERAIRQAFSSPEDINLNKVHAQWARRILDRLVGYLISPLLWRKVKSGLSAGRVQSVALRMICEREQEIASFVPKEYWVIEALLEKERSSFKAKLTEKEGKKYRPESEQEATQVEEELKNSLFQVIKVEKKKKSKNPPPPLITSTLQQEANKLFNFPVKKTMQIAQRLYEGVELGERGPTGLITYMRTDSYRIADEALRMVRNYINQHFGQQHLLPSPNRFKSREGAQEAHEAIRPTDVNLTPEEVRPYLSQDEYKIYSLIWKRFVASQMKPFEFEETKVKIKAGRYTFEATGIRPLFEGYKKVLGEKTKEELLPPLKEGDILKLIELTKQQKFTSPPPRYTEASLVKELEEKGIGRPSTYATIISTLQDRTYVFKEKGRFRPTQLGMIVTQLLKESFPDIMDYNYTAEMESVLDRVEEGKEGWQEALKVFYEKLAALLKKAEESMPSIHKQGLPYGKKCPACGSPLLLRKGRYGMFVACSRYPECKYTSAFSPLTDQALSMVCPKCGSPLTVRKGQKRDFIACSNYPQCNYIYREETEFACPRGCGGVLVKRRGPKGRTFYGCSNYPDCEYTTSDQPVKEPCPSCGFPYMLKSKKGKKLYCPKCGAEKK